MASIDEIRGSAAHLPDGEMRDLCSKIIDVVEEHRSESGQVYWTFQNFSLWVDRPPNDEVLRRCLMFLVSAHDARLLDMHFLFFDPTNPDDVGEPIEDKEVAEAIKTGYLIAPVSGDEIKDFEQSLVPYFVLCKRLQA